MKPLIEQPPYTVDEISAVFYDLYGTEMVTDDGWKQYTPFELLASLEGWSRKEILERLDANNKNR